MNLVTLAEAVTKIAKNAGLAIMEIYEREEDFQVETKGDDSPLTIADRKANEIIVNGLEQLDPKFPIVSEENKEIPYRERRNFNYHWLVDPLDGTKEFIKRNGEFTVNIALIHEGHPILGVVYAPCLEEMYWGAREEGAFLANGKEVERLQTAHFSKEDQGLKVVCSRSHLNDATKNFVDQLRQPELVSTGSSLKFLMLAKGQAHLYPRLAPTMEWDTAAAQIILEEAGGSVRVADAGDALRYNKENLRNPEFIAYGNIQ